MTETSEPLQTVVSEIPRLVFPKTLEEANLWITQLREAYHREHAYVERLEAQVHRERDVVQFALYWYRARGMHKAPWLKRLKDVTAVLAAHPDAQHL